MAKYYIQYPKVQSQEAVFAKTGKTLAGFESRLNAIANAMDVRDSTMMSLRTQLKSAVKRIPPLANRVTAAGTAIGEIREEYFRAEKISYLGLMFPKLPSSMLSGLATLDTKDVLSNMSNTPSVASKKTAKSLASFWPLATIVNVGKNAVQNIKTSVSIIKDSISPGGQFYQAYTITKCAVGMGVSALALFGSITSLATGVGVPMGLLGTVYSANKLANCTQDLMDAIEGKYDKIGTTNYLKDGMTNLTGNENLASAIYTAGEIALGINGIYNLKDTVSSGIDWSKIPQQGKNVAGFIQETLNTNIDLNMVEKIRYNYTLLKYSIPDATQLYHTVSMVKSLGNKLGDVVEDILDFSDNVEMAF